MKKIEIKKISELLKSDKAVKIIVAIGFALILLILFSELFSFGSGSSGTAQVSAAVDADTYARQLETQLVAIVGEIRGVGRVRVMVTLEDLDERKVRGVAVVCEGGEDVFVKQKVVETVSKVLGISTAKVSVVS
jgi:stage III sporulation protein AG